MIVEQQPCGDGVESNLGSPSNEGICASGAEGWLHSRAAGDTVLKEERIPRSAVDGELSRNHALSFIRSAHYQMRKSDSLILAHSCNVG